jgi:hypothetical protein
MIQREFIAIFVYMYVMYIEQIHTVCIILS